MAKKPGFTLEQHDQLGIELQNIRDRIGEISEQLSEAYPLKLSGRLMQAVAIIDRLRGDLSTVVCRENQNLEGNFRIYHRNIGIKKA